MSRRFGDPENLTSKRDRYDQMPRWVVQSKKFKDGLTGAQAKLLIYFIRRIDWDTRMVPSIGAGELAKEVGFSRNLVSSAVKEMALSGFIALKVHHRRFSVQVLFQDPDASQTYVYPLSAEVKKCLPPSGDCNEICPRALGKVAQSARECGGESGSFLPDWVLNDESEDAEGYAPT